jgi:hypothetical protein
LLCGLGSVTNAVYPKRLSEAGLSPQSVLAAQPGTSSGQPRRNLSDTVYQVRFPLRDHLT